MGKKTSVYLSDAIAERVQASGLSLSELVQRGLDAAEPEPTEAVISRRLDEWGERLLQKLDGVYATRPPLNVGGFTVPVVTDDQMPSGAMTLVSHNAEGDLTAAGAVNVLGPKRQPKECLHPKVRVKGSCPDCLEYVTSKARGPQTS